jgi:hypothetical protein
VAYDVHRSQQLAAESVMAKRVQTSGVPDDLPSNSDFRPTAASIDLTYTQSWLVCRYIAETYSAQDLGELYVRLDRSAELGGALEDVLGLTGEAFREGWRDYLAQLANR